MIIYGLQSIGKLSYFIVTRAFSFQLLEKYVYYIIVVGAICVIYIVISPLIRWLVSLYSIRLLSYIVSSLFIVTLILIGVYVRDDLEGAFFSILELTLQCLSFFGMVLLVSHLFKHVMYKNKQKSSYK